MKISLRKNLSEFKNPLKWIFWANLVELSFVFFLTVIFFVIFVIDKMLERGIESIVKNVEKTVERVGQMSMTEIIFISTVIIITAISTGPLLERLAYSY